eukprot:Nitzschia sp. Nitz4//scaffold8_size234185//148934//150277//NITZ4_001273-RA/size234185-processed-gene-0.163-mRNA-1//-1//CDS//3329559854//1490//frame0
MTTVKRTRRRDFPSLGRGVLTAAVALGGLFFVTCCYLQQVVEQADDLSPQARIPRPLESVVSNVMQRTTTDLGLLRHKRHKPSTTTAHRHPNPGGGGGGGVHTTHADVEATVRAMRTLPKLEPMDDQIPYDVHQCPEEIPHGYPMQWSVLDVLSHWNPDNTTVPDKIYQGLCTLDWNDPHQQRLAEMYRQAEMPFLLHNHPDVWKTAARWSDYHYLENLLGSDDYRNEHSPSNHMPYWKIAGHQKAPPGWVAPTENVQLSFPEWYAKAMELEHANTTVDKEHWYFRLNGLYHGKNGFLYDELPMFVPKEPSFFMPEPSGQRGINCRFGSKGIIAETHYDYSRNFILILQGRKRYVLADPGECSHLELYKPGHPSSRHSRVNWSDPNDWGTGEFPKARVNEVVLQAGDALYLPTAWFHFIVSLNLNYQCNARSGITSQYEQVINECGF